MVLNGLGAAPAKAVPKLDDKAIAYIASRPDVIAAARAAKVRPRVLVLQLMAKGSPAPGLAGLGLSFSDVMEYYTQYQKARAAGQPQVNVQAAPPPAPAAPPPAPAPDPNASPWYSNMWLIAPIVAGIGILAALRLKRRK